MEKLFEPKSIALIGVSRNPAKLSHDLIRNVVDAGTESRIYPIGRSCGEMLGHRIYESMRDLPEPPDLVLISVGSDEVKSVIAEAVEVGAGVAVVLSSGFGETRDEKGRGLEQELLSIARSSGLRIMGPNCLGIYNADANLNGSYLIEAPMRRGNISVSSQSGAYCGILVNEMNARGMGLNKFASIGNQVDIRHQDIVDYLADDEGTQVIGLFVEGTDGARGLLESIKRASRTKPVVVFKAGRTSAGRRAAASHTGSMAGDFAVSQAAFRQAGAIPACTTEEFHDCLFALSLNYDRLPKDNRVAIVTISGGPSVIASDACEESGLDVPQLSDAARNRLRALLPSFAADSNPVDMTVATLPENLGPAVDTVIGEPFISGAIAINWGWDRVEFAHAFVDAANKHNKPVVCFASANPKVQEIFRENRVLNLPSPERAVQSYRALVHYARTKWTRT